jgi:hypothetical protein
MLKHLITFTLLLMVVPAVGYLVAPAAMLTIVGITSNPQLDFVLRTSGVGLLAQMPGAWALRTDTSSRTAPAVAAGLVGYLVLSAVVDFHAYLQALVSFAAVPSIVLRLGLGAAIGLLMRRYRIRPA